MSVVLKAIGSPLSWHLTAALPTLNLYAHFDFCLYRIPYCLRTTLPISRVQGDSLTPPSRLQRAQRQDVAHGVSPFLWCPCQVCPLSLSAFWNQDFCSHCSFFCVSTFSHSAAHWEPVCVHFLLIMRKWHSFRHFWAEVVINTLVVSFQPHRHRPRGATYGWGCFSAFLWPPFWDSFWLYWYATEAKRPNLGMFLLFTLLDHISCPKCSNYTLCLK